MSLALGLLALSFFVAADVQFYAEKLVVVVLVAFAATSLMFSLAKGPKQPELAMANGDGQNDETLELEGLGMKGRVRGKRIVTDNFVILFIALALVISLYMHHNANEVKLEKLSEAIAENTYVLSLPQAEREKLNIAMPESLRRKVRHREP